MTSGINSADVPTPEAVTRRPSSPTLPLLLWFLIQLTPLVLAAAGVPLATGTAGYPQPAEQVALHLMVATQIAASAVLFPVLLRTAPLGLMVIVTAWPFQLAAGYLAAQSAAEVLPLSLFVSSWLIGLTLWRATLITGPLRRLGTALASGLTLGGAALWYLAAEFGPPPSPTDLPPPAHFGPLAAGLALIPTSLADTTPPPAWHSPAVWAWPAVLIAGGLVGVARIRRRARQPSVAPALV